MGVGVYLSFDRTNIRRRPVAFPAIMGRNGHCNTENGRPVRNEELCPGSGDDCADTVADIADDDAVFRSANA